jgi:hypothetical protein
MCAGYRRGARSWQQGRALEFLPLFDVGQLSFEAFNHFITMLGYKVLFFPLGQGTLLLLDAFQLKLKEIYLFLQVMDVFSFNCGSFLFSPLLSTAELALVGRSGRMLTIFILRSRISRSSCCPVSFSRGPWTGSWSDSMRTRTNLK